MHKKSKKAWTMDKADTVADKGCYGKDTTKKINRDADDDNVLSKDDRWKYVLNTLAFVFCIIGCSVQVLMFTKFYLRYDVTTDIVREYAQKLTFPAITICNNNKFRKNAVCKYFSQYCNDGGVTINYKEELDIIFTSTADVLKDISHARETLVSDCTTSSLDKSRNIDQKICGRNATTTSTNGVNCIVLNSQQDPILHQEHVKMPVHEYLFLTLNFEPEEHVNGTGRVGANFIIHNPKDTPNCQTFGYFVQPGHAYLVRLSQTSHHALPAPYRSKCTDYDDEWLKNGKKGPRTQNMCMHMESLSASMKYCNCYSSQISLTNAQLKQKCLWNGTTEFTNDCSKQTIMNETQLEICRPDCQLEHYDYEVVPDPVIAGKFHKTLGKTLKHPNFTTSLAILMIGYDNNLFSKTVQSPKIERLEILSYIGGYIGAWLGFSTLQVLQFVPTIIIFWKKRRANA